MLKKNLKIFVLGFLVIALAAAVAVVQKVQETRRGATGTGLPVVFSPVDGNYQIGETITTYIDLGQPSGKKVSTFILKVIYNSDYLTLKTTNANDAKGSSNIVINTYSISGSQITIIGGASSFATGNLRAVKLEFEAKGEGEAEVKLAGGSQVLTCTASGSGCQPGTEEVITDFAQEPAVYTIEGGGERPEITVSLSPAQGEKKIGESFRVDFSANTGASKITGLETIFTFEESELEVLNIDFPTGPNTPFDSVLLGSAVDGRARIVLITSETRADADLKSGNLALGHFTLRGKKTGTANFSLELADFAGIAADGSPLDNEVIRPGDLRGSYTIIDESSDYCEDRGGKCVITYECLNLVPGGECRSGPIGCDSSSCCCFGDFAQTCTPPDYRCSSGEFQECTHGVSWWHNHPSGADCIIAQCTERNFRCFQNREQECDTGSLGSFWRDTGNACEGPTATPTKVLPAQCSVGGATGYCEYLTEPCLDDYTGYSGDVVCDSAGGRCCIQDVPPETPSLTFKIKFDEVDEQIPDQRVILTVKKRGIAKKVTDVVVTSDENGILTGEVDLLGIVPGAGYYFIIKGPKHVAERFCLAGQDVHCPAEQTLTLRMENVFDFSGWPLRPGDITGEEGVQDGKIDSLDWSFLADALISDDEAVRKQANLNYDLLPDGGQIIAGDDIRLFVKTMGTRYDDDY